MVRATHGVHNGAYFWEAQILSPEPFDEHSHVRLGWSTRMGELQAPVGYDKHSYAYRDESGSKVHSSHRIDNYGEAFGPGDIIGMYLYLDIDDSSNNQMRFFKNGKDQGIAYKGKEIPQGVYFPAVSVFKTAQVRVNFGPSFILRHDIYGANAVSEVQPMSPDDRKVHEQRILDVRKAIAASQDAAAAPANDAAASDHLVKEVVPVASEAGAGVGAGAGAGAGDVESYPAGNTPSYCV